MSAKRQARSWRDMGPVLERIREKEAERAEKWRRKRLEVLPVMWRRHVEAEHVRRGGVDSQAANLWLIGATESAGGRLPMSASDMDIREAAIEAARVAFELASAEMESGAGHVGVRRALEVHCKAWGIRPAEQDGEPGLLRMLCERWYLRRLRREHGRRCEGAAIAAGVVRRGLWPYASQDAVERRQDQRRRNARAMDSAVIECEATGESLKLAEVVAGSVANPEVKRSELMVRIRGCDAIATENGDSCEFWTLTTPSRMHSQRVTGYCGEPNPVFDGTTPKEAQAYLSRVWARARSAWKRRGLAVFGLRTAEPHHDGTPHWHLIVYGPRRDLRFARRLLRVYALRDSADEPGAKKYRFKAMEARAGTKGAAYAAKYVSKNINGAGLGEDIDHETGKPVPDTVLKVDAWAAAWGIRQFQFFGCPAISGWRVLRRIRQPFAVVGSMLERARAAADDSDFAGYWRAAVAGGLRLLYRASDAVTAYGDAAAARIAGVGEGAGRRAMLPVKKWVIHWAGKRKGVAFDLPWSCVNNCTEDEMNPAAALFA